MNEKVRNSILASVSALLFTFGGWKTQPLSAITKPYLGTYECESVYYGNKEITDNFKYIRLELKDEERFSLCFCEPDGKKKEYGGTYRYDERKKRLTLTGENGGFKREFPLSGGTIVVSVPIMEKLLNIKFKQT